MARNASVGVQGIKLLREIKKAPQVKAINRVASSCACNQRTKCPVVSRETTQLQQSRPFISLPKFPGQGQTNKRKEYCERRLLGYSMEQMFAIVSEVEKYDQFVPWCKKAIVTKRQRKSFNCKLEIGFPPLVERYNSLVTVERPNYVKSECTEGVLFDHLLTIWKFSPADPAIPNSCMLDFSVAFKFRSALHSQLSHIFFDEVVRQMVNAFLKRAKKLHGQPSIKAQKPKILVSNS